MDFAANVLRECPELQESFELTGERKRRITNADYRAAVAQTIRDIKASQRLSNEKLGELLGVSEGTIANAENEVGNLDPVTMLNIAVRCGGFDALGLILALTTGAPFKPLSIKERLERIEREAAAIRKEIA